MATAPLSWSMRLLLTWLRLGRRRDMYASASQLHAMLQSGVRAAACPASDAELQVTPLPAPDAWQCWQLSPQTPTARSPACWLYLHGGAYVRPISQWHWHLLRQLVINSGCTVLVPLYPLAPASSCAQTLASLQQAAVPWLEAFPRWGVMGDSAGAGMAVALSLALREAQQTLPRQLLLITPWLDLSLSDEECLTLAPQDAMLAVAGAREAGRLYAGEQPVIHPWCSPVNADLHALPPTHLWWAQHDICTPASLRFAALAQQAGSSVQLHPGWKMPHVWPLMPTPEGSAARQQLAAYMQALADE